jgi:peptidoglycan glycosyltransferase
VLFARLGLQLSGDQLANHMTRLGIGRPVDLPLELSSGQILERGVWTDLIVARTAMGQGEVLVTPLEMAMVVAAVADDGMQAPPRLVLQIEGQPASAPTAPREVLTKKTAQQVQAILAQAIAVRQDDIPLSASGIAGRAGTADSGLPGAPPHAWFIGFAPIQNPRYAVAVIVEHGSEGWQVAAPIGIQALNQAIAAGK